MNRRSRALLPAVLAVPLLLAACGSETTALPDGLGPLALTNDVALPDACVTATGTGAVTIGAARSVLGNPSYTERKARGCLPFTVSQVWQALQIPTGVDVGFWPERNNSRCEAWLTTDPAYPINFVTKEIPFGNIEQHYTFEVTWRIGVTPAGTEANPTTVNILYGKTSGTVEVPKILGSVVVTADPDHAGWIRIDMVRQLNTNGWSDDPAKLQMWLQDFFDGLRTQLSTGTLQPRYCNLP